jgi:hypothetical protein
MSSTVLTIAIARDPERMVDSHFIRKCVVLASSTDDQKERASSLGMVSEGWGAVPAGRHHWAFVQCHTKYVAGLIAEMRQNRWLLG